MLSRKTIFAILILSLVLRLIGLDWDQGFGLHPDERMVMMVADRIGWENLNPEFFNYGNLPIYLLRFVSSSFAQVFGLRFAQYPDIMLVGRGLSALFDTGTVYLVYLIAKRIWHKKTGLVAAFLYATAVFPIQNAHYYTVDTMLTFWTTLTVYLSIRWWSELSWKRVSVIGVVVGLAGATKVTGMVAVVAPLIAIAANAKRSLEVTNITQVIVQGIVLMLGVGVSFFITQPYVLLNYSEFLRQITEQLKMNADATVFPYTYQFLNTTAYLDPLLEIARWGLGWPLLIICLTGIVFVLYDIVRKSQKDDCNRTLPKYILLGFLFLYFAVLGRSAVKFMRYFLPLYPILVVLGGYAIVRILSWGRKRYRESGAVVVVLTTMVILVWPLAFVQIYLHPHPRIAATEWMDKNLPTGTVIAIEHWDDQVPLRNSSGFRFETLEVYQPETSAKWHKITTQLDSSDYLVISSKRVYRSIMNWPQRYPITTDFYNQLFSNRTDFQLIKTFTNYPRINFGSFVWEFNDDTTQESFTSYDHPKVMVFEKQR